MRKLLFSFVFLALGASFAHADDTKDAVAVELGFIKRVFQTGYAPREWKKQFLNWDIDTVYNTALADLSTKATIDVWDYRKLVGDMLGSTRDYHVGWAFYSTEAARLPFLIKGNEGRYFIVWLDTTKIDRSVFPFQEGDEVLTWNGQPIQAEVDALRAQFVYGVETTDQRLAERMLTRRSASRGIRVPNGFVEIGVRRLATGQEFSRQLHWEYTPEAIAWNSVETPAPVRPMANPAHNGILKHRNMTWGMWTDVYEGDVSKERPSVSGFDIGARTSYVPDLGPVIWQSAETDKFHAYIYKNASNRLIGVVRIPSYMGSLENFQAFREIIRKFEKLTDAMVIDQINNPGGSVFYISALMSVLSPTPIWLPGHEVSMFPSFMQENYTETEKAKTVTNDQDARRVYGNDLDGYPVTYQWVQGLLNYGRFIDAEWRAGKTLSANFPLFGVEKVAPDTQVTYSKPILVLVNELDFSGGDFFPAILQDNMRAKIFGQRTSGAGGYVNSVEFPSGLGLQRFSFTGSLAHRLNNDPIENLGVVPDIPYVHTERDFTEGMIDYKNAINTAVDGLLQAPVL